MATAHKTSAADRQGICKKLVRLLKKQYKTPIPQRDDPVLETILHAICLEDSTVEQADSACQRLQASFHDLNEIRVSSISELTTVLKALSRPEFRAMEIRSALQYIFESEYAFDLESLRRRTLDLATKQLARIKNLSVFVRSYTLQTILGAHIVPTDQPMANVAVWLGLAGPGADPKEATASLKSAVRKSDVPMFCHLLRATAVDSRFQKIFAVKNLSEDGYDPHTAPARLTELFKTGGKPSKKEATRKKTTPKKTATRSAKKTKSSGKKAAAKSTASTRSVRKKKSAVQVSSTKKKTAARKKTAAKSKTAGRKKITRSSAVKKKKKVSKTASSRKTAKRSRKTTSR